ncbi:hypothetical protein [Rhizocola hellebori]|nr:hypothetical protein [Rhizocola hellebori]
MLGRPRARSGGTRYNDFRNELGIATNILKTRLDWLVDAGNPAA